MEEIRSLYPDAQIIGCSTAGEICGTQVWENTLVVTAISFAHTTLSTAETCLGETTGSFAAGQRLGATLPADGLSHVLVLSDGLHVNGSELVKGLAGALPPAVAITGGLSGDADRFKKTLVWFDHTARENRVVAIGLYSKHLRVGYGSLGGWDPFGPERIITRSRGNILYELDGESALALYKRYLGEHATSLPSSGLLFPLSLRDNSSQTAVVRTILAVNEADQSMTFAGDMPQGMKARLMRANLDRLVDGATGAASTCRGALQSRDAELAILISCVGRKLILKQRTEEEVEGVHTILGPGAAMTGFYSYGEISPFTPAARCELHNQTMTITVFSEAT